MKASDFNLYYNFHSYPASKKTSKMKQSKQPSAELFVATGCNHCPVVLNELSEQLKKGHISTLTITNIAVDNERAAELNVRTVPWFALTNDNSFMIFSGNYTPKEIQQWVATSQTKNGMQDYIEELLMAGQLTTITQAIQLKPEIFPVIIEMIENEETSMHIRIGLDALIENFSATEILQQSVPELKRIASGNNVRLQIDALHYIALTGDAENKDFLQELTKHQDQQVKDAAIEALETLDDLIN